MFGRFPSLLLSLLLLLLWHCGANTGAGFISVYLQLLPDLCARRAVRPWRLSAVQGMFGGRKLSAVASQRVPKSRPPLPPSSASLPPARCCVTGRTARCSRRDNKMFTGCASTPSRLSYCFIVIFNRQSCNRYDQSTAIGMSREKMAVELSLNFCVGQQRK